MNWLQVGIVIVTVVAILEYIRSITSDGIADKIALRLAVVTLIVSVLLYLTRNI